MLQHRLSAALTPCARIAAACMALTIVVSIALSLKARFDIAPVTTEAPPSLERSVQDQAALKGSFNAVTALRGTSLPAPAAAVLAAAVSNEVGSVPAAVREDSEAALLREDDRLSEGLEHGLLRLEEESASLSTGLTDRRPTWREALVAVIPTVEASFNEFNGASAGDSKWRLPGSRGTVRNRSPSFPFLTGDGFRAHCKFVCADKGCAFEPGDVKTDNECVFVSNTDFDDGFLTTNRYAEEFFQRIAPQLEHEIVIVSHNGDISFPDNVDRQAWEPSWPHRGFSSQLANPSRHVKAWFAQNCFWNGPALKPAKLSCIPIGIENRYNSKGSDPGRYLRAWKRWDSASRTGPVRDTLLLMDFGESRIKPDRGRALRALQGRSFITRSSGMGHDTWMDKVSRSKFVLCPHGHGLDSHRTWEVLMMGAFPVVRSSTLDSLYDGLPVLIVQKWTHVTEELLMERHKLMSESTAYHVDRLFWSHWKSQLEAAQQA